MPQHPKNNRLALRGNVDEQLTEIAPERSGAVAVAGVGGVIGNCAALDVAARVRNYSVDALQSRSIGQLCGAVGLKDLTPARGGHCGNF